MIRQFFNKPSFSDQALSSALDGSLITLKLTRDRPVERNTVDRVEQRYDYARWLICPNVVMKIEKRRPSLLQSIWSTQSKYHGLYRFQIAKGLFIIRFLLEE